MSELQRANNLGRKMYTIVTSILFVAYLIQAIQGSTGLGVFAALVVTDLGPMIAAHIAYKIKPDSKWIKHIIGIGYGFFYTVNCFTSAEQMVFVYAIPMLLVVTIYCDMKFSLLVSCVISTIATVHAIYFAGAHGWTHEVIASLEIEIAAIFLTCGYAYVANSYIAKLNGRRMDEINEAGAKTQGMLDKIMVISGNLADEVAEVSDKMVQLSDSSEDTLASMTEVQSGTGETANSIQNQLIKTEEIQNQINKVASASDSIGTNVNSAVEAISEGKANVDKLIAQAKVSEQAANGAVNEVQELKKSTEQMESIVQMINNVASQTSLLALNASIEAARAGEAGRGFSVVATEISNLAAQTQTATGNISNLIANVTKEMEDVAKAIVSLVDSNKIQNESAQVTSGSFEKIVDSATLIKTDSQSLASIVGMLEAANKEIIEGIQTISAVTEEVSAHSQTTCEISEQNKLIVEGVQKIVEEMTHNADQLKAI